MPEIPELEAFKEVIASHCVQKKIINVTAVDTKLIQTPLNTFKKNLIGNHFTTVQRLGKFLVVSLSSSDYKLVLHFGLTGFLVYTTDTTEKISFSQVQFLFKQAVLHWINIRKFGKIWLLKDITHIKELDHLGYDPLTLSQKQFLELVEKNKKKNIKTFLMDQSLIAGIGNEYSDEMLFQAGIDPRHTLAELNSTALKNLYKQMNKVLKYAIKLRIQDIKKYPTQNFLSLNDKKTFKNSYLQAHRHGDMRCPKNKAHALKKVTIGGRSAYFCPIDQK